MSITPKNQPKWEQLLESTGVIEFDLVKLWSSNSVCLSFLCLMISFMFFNRVIWKLLYWNLLHSFIPQIGAIWNLFQLAGDWTIDILVKFQLNPFLLSVGNRWKGVYGGSNGVRLFGAKTFPSSTKVFLDMLHQAKMMIMGISWSSEYPSKIQIRCENLPLSPQQHLWCP